MNSKVKRAQRQYRAALRRQDRTRGDLLNGERLDLRDLTHAHKRVERAQKRANREINEARKVYA